MTQNTPRGLRDRGKRRRCGRLTTKVEIMWVLALLSSQLTNTASNKSSTTQSKWKDIKGNSPYDNGGIVNLVH